MVVEVVSAVVLVVDGGAAVGDVVVASAIVVVVEDTAGVDVVVVRTGMNVSGRPITSTPSRAMATVVQSLQLATATAALTVDGLVGDLGDLDGQGDDRPAVVGVDRGGHVVGRASQ